MSQPSLKDWLNRKPAGPKPRKRLKQTPLRRVSSKHGKKLREYFRVRADYLAKQAACEAGLVILKAKLPEFYHVPRCEVWAKEVHHIAGRGSNLCNTDTFCAICPECHRWVHAHGQKAREIGLLV